jgi:hypothetical protein
MPLYPGYPAMPGGGAAAAMARPTPVIVAFWLVLGGVVLVMLMLVLALLLDWATVLAQARESVAEDGPYTEAEVRTVARITAGVYTLGIGIPATLYIVFAFLMRGGRNWARVTLTVLLSIGMAAALITAIVPLPVVVRLLVIPLVAISITAIVAMFARDAGPYFDYRARMGSWTT